MFDFGKDLRKLFAQSRDGEDLGWLELISVPLLESEARQQSIDAGRISCREPGATAVRAAAVWREHARRTGRGASIAKALDLAGEAGRHAVGPDQAAEAMLDAGLTTLLDYDLRGGPARLARTAAFLEAARDGRTASLKARVMAAHGRFAVRRAWANGGSARSLDIAVGVLDDAMRAMRGHADLAAERIEVRLDRAALTLEAGVRSRDSKLLDRAGRDLQALVEDASPDYQPLTRARALTLCAAGWSRLAAMAGDEAAAIRAHEMFDAAAEVFTPDHSPLNWAAIQLAMVAEGRAVSPETLARAEMVTAGEGLILGALARAARTMGDIDDATARGDLARLMMIEARLRRRLVVEMAGVAPSDWVADQIGLAAIGLSRANLLGAASDPTLQFALMEAIEVAEEAGTVSLSARARRLRTDLALTG